MADNTTEQQLLEMAEHMKEVVEKKEVVLEEGEELINQVNGSQKNIDIKHKTYIIFKKLL